MTKAAEIMAALQDAVSGERADWRRVEVDPAAIVTAVNLFPLYEAVREAARDLIRTDGLDSFTPESDRAVSRVMRALDALQAAEDAL